MIRFLVTFTLLLSFVGSPANAQFSGGGGGPAPTSKQSTEQLQAGCDGGDSIHCEKLGMRYLEGDGVVRNAKTAAALFQRACDGGDEMGCFDVAESYRFGDGVAKNLKTAAGFYQRACDGKYAPACAELALLYIDGNGVSKDISKTALYADRACNGGAQIGCALLGAVYAEGVAGYPKDLRRAEDLLHQACFKDVNFEVAPDRTSIVACGMLTSFTGQPACQRVTYPGGPTEDRCFEAPRAWKVTEVRTAPAAPPAAAAAPPRVDPVATGNNAVNAGNAAYARKDYAAAAAQFAIACDADNASACGVLGEMYLKGEGVLANGARAAGPLAKACDAGIAVACRNLGSLYADGRGVPLRKDKALALYNNACVAGLTDACDLVRQATEPPPTKHEPQQVLNSTPTNRPASAAQSRLLASAIRQDSYSWIVNEYDNGSLRDVQIIDSKNGVITIRGDYTFNQGENGWIAAQIVNNNVSCIYYWDTSYCNPVRKAPYYVSNPREEVDCYFVNEIRTERVYVDNKGSFNPGYWTGGVLQGLRVTNHCKVNIIARDETDGTILATVSPGETKSVSPDAIFRFK